MKDCVKLDKAVLMKKGIRQGSAGKGSLEQDNLTPKYSQEDLSKDLQISKQQLQDYKKLTNLIPELQQMIENGSMKATVGYKIWAKMPQGEQEKFFNDRVSLRNSVLKRY